MTEPVLPNPVLPNPVLEVRGLTKSFGALKATDAVSLALVPGEIHALIGPYGAGTATSVARVAGQCGAALGRCLGV